MLLLLLLLLLSQQDIELSRRYLEEADPRRAVERAVTVVAATADLQTQVARAQVWLQGVPARRKQLEYVRGRGRRGR